MQKIIPDTVLLERLIKVFRHFFFFGSFLLVCQQKRTTIEIDRSITKSSTKRKREFEKFMPSIRYLLMHFLSNQPFLHHLKFKTFHLFSLIDNAPFVLRMTTTQKKGFHKIQQRTAHKSLPRSSLWYHNKIGSI